MQFVWFTCDWYFDSVVHFAFQWILQITFAGTSLIASSTPKNLIDRKVDQYCDKDNLSSLSAFQFSFDFVLSGSSLSLILSNLLRNRDKDNQVCNKYK
jgi:hypothetical protein